MLNYPAWKNGQYCEVKDLTVSILDLGLIHCDATYDVLAVKGGIIQNLDAHMSRFFRSCDGWNLPISYNMEDLVRVFKTLVSSSEQKDLLLWVGVTRGIPSSGNPRDLANCVPNVFAYVKPYFGFNAINEATVCLSRQIRNDAIDQTMKNFCWNDLNIAQWEAIGRGYNTAILPDRYGYITEGPGFNVGFVSVDGFVYAPKHNRLQGTTMDLVKEFCYRNNIQFFYADITHETILREMDAMFLTSTAGNVITVTKYEGIEFKRNPTLELIKNAIV